MQAAPLEMRLPSCSGRPMSQRAAGPDTAGCSARCGMQGMQIDHCSSSRLHSLAGRSTWHRPHQRQQHWETPRAASVVGDGLSELQRAGGNGSKPAAAGLAAVAAAAAAPLLVAPEDFQLAPGVLSHVDTSRPLAESDVFRCAACSRPECQVGARGDVRCNASWRCSSWQHTPPLPRPPLRAAMPRALTPPLLTALQTAAGCASEGMAWRHAPGGYLREVLTASVYDVAVETPLERAEQLRCVAVAGGRCFGSNGPERCRGMMHCIAGDGVLNVPSPPLCVTCLVCRRCSEALGATVLLKREDLQPVKSFKLRGAYNKMAQLSQEQVRAGSVRVVQFLPPPSSPADFQQRRPPAPLAPLPLQLARGVICSSAGNHAQGVALAARRLGCSAVIVMPVTTPDIKVTAVRALGGEVELVGESYQEAQAHAQVWRCGWAVCVCVGGYAGFGWDALVSV